VFCVTGAKTFHRCKPGAPRIRLGGNLCPLRRSRRAKRQQGIDCGHPPSSPDRGQRDRPGFQVAGDQSKTCARAAARTARAEETGATRGREGATREAAPPAFTPAPRLEETHPRIKAPKIATKEIAEQRGRLRTARETNYKIFAGNTSGRGTCAEWSLKEQLQL
jgi:hypothetical protein